MGRNCGNHSSDGDLMDFYLKRKELWDVLTTALIGISWTSIWRERNCGMCLPQLWWGSHGLLFEEKGIVGCAYHSSDGDLMDFYLKRKELWDVLTTALMGSHGLLFEEKGIVGCAYHSSDGDLMDFYLKRKELWDVLTTALMKGIWDLMDFYLKRKELWDVLTTALMGISWTTIWRERNCGMCLPQLWWGSHGLLFEEKGIVGCAYHIGDLMDFYLKRKELWDVLTTALMGISWTSIWRERNCGMCLPQLWWGSHGLLFEEKGIVGCAYHSSDGDLMDYYLKRKELWDVLTTALMGISWTTIWRERNCGMCLPQLWWGSHGLLFEEKGIVGCAYHSSDGKGIVGCAYHSSDGDLMDFYLKRKELWDVLTTALMGISWTSIWRERNCGMCLPQLWWGSHGLLFEEKGIVGCAYHSSDGKGIVGCAYHSSDGDLMDFYLKRKELWDVLTTALMGISWTTIWRERNCGMCLPQLWWGSQHQTSLYHTHQNHHCWQVNEKIIASDHTKIHDSYNTKQMPQKCKIKSKWFNW